MSSPNAKRKRSDETKELLTPSKRVRTYDDVSRQHLQERTPTANQHNIPAPPPPTQEAAKKKKQKGRKGTKASKTSSQIPQNRPVPSSRSAKDFFRKMEWKGLKADVSPNVDALQQELLAAAVDFRQMYDKDSAIGRLLDGTISLYDVRMTCYMIANAILDLHNENIGTINKGKADPTLEPKGKVERESTIEERIQNAKQALRFCKKIIADCFDEPERIPYLLVLAPKFTLYKRHYDMGLNDHKAKEAAEKKAREERGEVDPNPIVTGKGKRKRAEKINPRPLRASATPQTWVDEANLAQFQLPSTTYKDDSEEPEAAEDERPASKRLKANATNNEEAEPIENGNGEQIPIGAATTPTAKKSLSLKTADEEHRSAQPGKAAAHTLNTSPRPATPSQPKHPLPAQPSLSSRLSHHEDRRETYDQATAQAPHVENDSPYFNNMQSHYLRQASMHASPNVESAINDVPHGPSCDSADSNMPRRMTAHEIAVVSERARLLNEEQLWGPAAHNIDPALRSLGDNSVSQAEQRRNLGVSEGMKRRESIAKIENDTGDENRPPEGFWNH